MEHLLSFGTAFGGIAAFLFGLYQYLDTRRREDQGRRFSQYREIFGWVAGRTPDGMIHVDTQQAIAVYQLSEFPEYSEITLPMLVHYLTMTIADADYSLFRGSLLYTKSKLGGETRSGVHSSIRGGKTIGKN